MVPGLTVAFVPSRRTFPRPVELPEPDRHIFYHRRVADIADAIPKLSGYWAEARPMSPGRFSRRPFWKKTAPPGAGAAIATKGNRSERDLRHSVNTQAAYRPAALRLASLPEDAMDLSTKLKITAVLATVLMAVVWAIPVPV